MISRGNYTILAMLLLALSMAGFAWWWNLGRGSKCIAFWGPAAARSIRQTAQVTVFELTAESSTEAAESIPFGEEKLAIGKQQDITGLRGLIHARNSLLEDTSFRWEETVPNSPHWRYALRWTEDSRQVTALFALDEKCLAFVEGKKMVRLTDFSAQAWSKVLPRYLTEEVVPAPHIP